MLFPEFTIAYYFIDGTSLKTITSWDAISCISFLSVFPASFFNQRSLSEKY
jgi:hypothetical protein